MLAPSGRSLRFPTLRLPVSATGGGRLRSHRASMGKNLTKYNVALTRRRPGSWKHCLAQKEINPTFVGLISFLESGNVLLSRTFPIALSSPGELA